MVSRRGRELAKGTWAEEEIAALECLSRAGVALDEIASRLDRTESAVANTLYIMGCAWPARRPDRGRGPGAPAPVP
jgi:hypothetical protein